MLLSVLSRVEWLNSDEDDKTEVPSSHQALEMSERTSKLLALAFTSALSNTEHWRIRNAFSVPEMDVTRCPHLDPLFKMPSVKSNIKVVDTELVVLQAFVLDPVDPLVEVLKGLIARVSPLRTHAQFCLSHYAFWTTGTSQTRINLLPRLLSTYLGQVLKPESGSGQGLWSSWKEPSPFGRRFWNSRSSFPQIGSEHSNWGSKGTFLIQWPKSGVDRDLPNTLHCPCMIVKLLVGRRRTTGFGREVAQMA